MTLFLGEAPGGDAEGVRDVRVTPLLWREWLGPPAAPAVKRAPGFAAPPTPPPPTDTLKRGEPRGGVCGVVGEGESADSCARKLRVPAVACSGLLSHRPCRADTGFEARGTGRAALPPRAVLLELLLPLPRGSVAAETTMFGCCLFPNAAAAIPLRGEEGSEGG